MKILVCTFSFPDPNNNIHDSRFVLSEVIGYASSGAKVTVITPHHPGADKIETINENIEIIRFSYFLPKSLQVLRRPGKPIYDIGSVLALLQIPLLCLLFSTNILKHARGKDIIHAQWTPTALLALPAKWLLSKKVVLTARGSDIRLIPTWLNRYIFRSVDATIDCFGSTPWNRSNKATFASTYVKLPLLVLDDYSGKIPDEIKEIRDSVDSSFIILYVGRLHPIKLEENNLPIFDLLPAVKALSSNYPNLRLLYLGDGDREIIDKLSDEIKKLKLMKEVTLLGPRTNVIDYMCHCDLGVGGLATNGVSQEFTICNKAQILVDNKDNHNTLWRNQKNCLLFKPHDVMGLSSILEFSLKNTDKIESIGKKAANDMKGLLIESKTGGGLYIDAFNSILSG